VYGIDGLKVGPGIEGALFTIGDEPRIAPGTWPPAPPPRVCATAVPAPNKATHAAKDNVASTVRSILLLRIAISIEPVNLYLKISRQPAGSSKLSLGKLNSI
jgi:hypothetical protein